MCRRRQVRTVYRRCGHARTHPDVEVPCESTRCVFSRFHPRTCVGESCKKTCWHFRQAPEQFTEHVMEYCPNCLAA